MKQQNKNAVHPKQVYLEPVGGTGDIFQAGTSHGGGAWQIQTLPGAEFMPFRDRESLLPPTVLWTLESLHVQSEGGTPVIIWSVPSFTDTDTRQIECLTLSQWQEEARSQGS